jgi:hypothetical protein
VQTEHDVKKVTEKGCTAIMNIMNGQDMDQRGVNWSWLCQQYRNNGVQYCINEPVSDVDENQYCNDLFRAALQLHDLRDIKNQKVYLNCAAGVSRAPTLMIVYLALFIKHKDWQNVDELYQYLENQYRWQDANLKVARLVIARNKDFQEKQYKLYLEEEERKRREAEEAERQRLLNANLSDAERQRLLKLKEQEEEKLRQQRLQFAEAEKLRLEKVERDKHDRLRRMKQKEDEELRQAEIDGRNLDEEIKEARAKLERLQKESKDRIRKERDEDERNQKIQDMKRKQDEDDEQAWMIRLAKVA